MSDRHRSSDYNDGYRSLPDRTSSKSRSDARENKDIRLRKLLGLLTNVQELTTSLWKDLDNEQGQNCDLQSKESEIFKLQKENKALQDEIDRLKLGVSTTRQNEADAKIKSLQKKINESEQQTEHEKRARMEAEKKYQEGKKTHAESLKVCQQTIDQQEAKIRTLEKEERKSKEELVKRSEQRATVNTFSERYHNLEQQLKKTQRELKNTKDELEHTKTRLSESMGAKLTDNNPNIADLSDKNRPTKLSERFQEIYDNEWTDAFEVFVADKDDDEKAVSVLLSILMDTKEFCDQEADSQMKQIQCALIQEENSERNTGNAIPEIPANVNKLLKDSRKYMAEVSGKQLCKRYQEKLRFSQTTTSRKAKLVPEYLEACFSVCWMMAVQDPPVVFGPDIQTGDAFNTDIYKAYTKNGNTVAYVVWPALLLHANGPVLCKGVAQGLADSTRRTQSAPPYERRRQFSNDGRNWKGYSNDTHIIDSEQNGEYALNDQEYKQDLKYGTDSFDIYGTNARERNTLDIKSSLGGRESAMRGGYVSSKLLDDLDNRVYDQSTRDHRSGRSGYDSNPRTHYSGTYYNQSSTLAYTSGFLTTRYISDTTHHKPDNYPYSSPSYKQTIVTRQPRLEYKHTYRREQTVRPAWK